MRNLFLGKPLHWLFLIIVVGLSWWIGEEKVHVIHFNAFLIAMIATALVLILLVLRTTRPDEQVTRDPLPDLAAIDAEDDAPIRDPDAGA